MWGDTEALLAEVVNDFNGIASLPEKMRQVAIGRRFPRPTLREFYESFGL